MTIRSIVRKHTLALCLIVICGSAAHAQNSDHVTVNEGATIAQPLRLTKVSDLQWGGIITGSVQGNVVLAASGNSFTETFPTGLNGPVAFTGHSLSITAPSIAGFTVTGEPGMSYSITVNPGASHVYCGSNAMLVSLAFPRAATVNGFERTHGFARWRPEPAFCGKQLRKLRNRRLGYWRDADRRSKSAKRTLRRHLRSNDLLPIEPSAINRIAAAHNALPLLRMAT
jgi:hypothetical protein